MNLENSEEKVYRNIAGKTLELIFDLASRRMLKSLFQIGYLSEESYTEDEYDKLLDSQKKICDQLLQEIFKEKETGKMKETLDETYFKQKIESYKFLQSLEQIRNCVF